MCFQVRWDVWFIACLVFTNVTSALEVFLNVMRYINPRFTYLLTYYCKFLGECSSRRISNIGQYILMKLLYIILWTLLPDKIQLWY